MRLMTCCVASIFALLVPAACAFAAPVYFLVSEIPGQEVHHDSYVVPLTDPGHIAHARDLIANGTSAGETIVVAAIAPGSDGINRNITAPGQPLWNWHVTSFDGFADSTIEILDGWPSDVEKDVPAWINNTNGFIGFWSYTITRELDAPSAVPLPAPILGGAMMLAVAGYRVHRARKC